MDVLSPDKARAFLEAAPVAHIAVVTEGDPYVTPMSFVVDGARIIFRTAAGRRFTAMMEHPTVSIEASEFDNESGDWTSVIVKGIAHQTTDDATVQLALEKLYAKYRDVLGSPLSRGGIQPMASLPHVVVVDIVEMTGMTSSGPFSVRTRPGRL